MAIRVLSHSHVKTCKHVKNMEFLDFEMENGTSRKVGWLFRWCDFPMRNEELWEPFREILQVNDLKCQGNLVTENAQMVQMEFV